jgi:hypothetical protein
VCKWIHALTLALALGASLPSMASIITGVDEILAPVTDYTLPFRADGVFDSTVINIGSSVSERSDTQRLNVTLRSGGDILVAGMINAPRTNLTLETPGQIVITAGSILTSDIPLVGDRVRLQLRPDALLLPPSGRITLTRSVPEPSTLWLVMLLPMLALLPKRQRV